MGYGTDLIIIVKIIVSCVTLITFKHTFAVKIMSNVKSEINQCEPYFFVLSKLGSIEFN